MPSVIPNSSRRHHSFFSGLGLLFCFFIHVSGNSLSAQGEWYWYNPLQIDGQVVQGQAWEGIGYGRLPLEAKEKVRETVWNLSQHSAGLKVKFQTQADSIKVKYLPTGRLEMPHMPATGVSGLDLYLREGESTWKWVKGKYQFADTVTYTFAITPHRTSPYEGMLYLPLYNGVSWMEIGVNGTLEFQSQMEANPILVYGTSIAHGASASRPGMAWPAQLERALDKPLVNLGFSGNGRLEPEVLEFIGTVKASLFILDCLPNLVPFAGYTEGEVKGRIKKAVQYLKDIQPDIPILLVEHAGYSDQLTDHARKLAVENVNKWSKSVFRELLMEGVEEIYYLEKEEIGMHIEATVDGTHPTDWGMKQYADAYVEIIKEILE
ncbi:SGNH/GDSL hydrolase family protein [Pleomorphovibrio marinus]|uniref:SGNH/GDSL hydrolase family protein n=1 Tax=Pleomorphovibrio marinus TaxID=2164132 RepID=UPI000E0C8F6A|nr:SGNH/GDSL hydrolase family protein [Pleomorphovibrio marinus]